HPPRTACDLAAPHGFHHWTGIWWTTRASSGASVGVDQLADRRDLPPQLVVACRLPGDLVAGVEHRGVVAPAELRADAQERDVGLLAHEEHRDLARDDDRLVALLALERVEAHAVVLGHG